jgi:hypothetical protein
MQEMKFGISMPTQNTSSPSHCVTMSLKSLDALRRFSGLDQIGQGRIRLCVRLHLRVLVHQQITDNPRKHDTAPRIQMRPIIALVVVLAGRRLANRVDVCHRRLVQVDVFETVVFCNRDRGCALFGEVFAYETVVVKITACQGGD